MMRIGSRMVVVVLLAAAGAYICESGTLACGSFAAKSAMSAVDFCFIFDCTNGAIGGLIDPCANVTGRDSGIDPGGQGGTGGGGGGGGGGQSGNTGNTGFSGTFLADCPQEDDLPPG